MTKLCRISVVGSNRNVTGCHASSADVKALDVVHCWKAAGHGTRPCQDGVRDAAAHVAQVMVLTRTS